MLVRRGWRRWGGVAADREVWACGAMRLGRGGQAAGRVDWVAWGVGCVRRGAGTLRVGVFLRSATGMSNIRVIIAKPGLDGHDRGAKVVARALRDAGVEVIYTGLHQTPEQIVAAALQEDADAIGLSILSGAHMTQFARVLELLREQNAGDIVVFGGGIIPDADVAELEAMGVAKIFTPGASTQQIVEWVRSALGEKAESRAG